MLAVRLPDDLQERLERLAQETGRTKSYYVRLALEEFLQDEADYRLALARLEKNNPRLSLEDVERRLGLAD
jgi:RHH-type transcriptional regulator, rel operon repressor / antitoxin RelB